MKQISLTGNLKPHTTTIENQLIDQYLAKASGENIKVLLMLMRLSQAGEPLSPSILAQKLDMTVSAINRALSYWEEEGLLASSEQETASMPASGQGGAMPNQTTDTTPPKQQLSVQKINQLREKDEFSHLIYITEIYLQHPMTQSELNSLSYIYDTLKMPVDLIEYLIEYCVSNHKTSFHYIEKVAINWHAQNIKTPTQAKNASASYQKEYYQIMKTMGLGGKPTPKQVEFMERWLYQKGFSMNLILEACNRTIMATGKASFPYADSILESWEKDQVRTLQDVSAADQRFAASKSAKKDTKPKPRPQQTKVSSQIHNFNERSYNFDELEQRYIEKINQ